MSLNLGKRTLGTSVLVALLACLGLSTAALAHRGPAHPRHASHSRSIYAAGWVTADDGTTLTVADGRGQTRSFALDASTRYAYQGGPAASADALAPGQVVFVRASAPQTSGANPLATGVVIHTAGLQGLVQGVNPGSLTVFDADGFTRTVKLGATTSCRQRWSPVDCATIAAGSIVSVRGSVDGDGTTLDAVSVSVRPAPVPQS